MKKSYKIIRALLLTVILLGITIPAVLYVALSLPSVQRSISSVAERELSTLLNARVKIGTLTVSPFNRLLLRDVTVIDAVNHADTLVSVERLGAGVNLYEFAAHRKVIINYAELIGLDGRVSRDSLGSPLNIQPIIDALSSKDPSRKPASFEFSVNTILIRNSAVSYDVDSMPRAGEGVLDPNHLRVYDLNADISLPLMRNDDFGIDIKRLSVKEQSGLSVDNLKGQFHIAASDLSVSGLSVALPRSLLSFSDMRLPLDGFASLKNRLLSETFDFKVKKGSYFTPADISPVVPVLGLFDKPVQLDIDLSGCAADMEVRRLIAFTDDRSMFLNVKGTIENAAAPDSMTFNFPKIELRVDCSRFARALPLAPAVANVIERVGVSELEASVSGSLLDIALKAAFESAPGRVGIEAEMKRRSPSSAMTIDGAVEMGDIDLNVLLPDRQLGVLTADADVTATLSDKLQLATASGKVSVGKLTFKGHSYRDIDLIANIDKKDFDAVIDIADPDANMRLSARGVADAGSEAIDLHGDIYSIRLDRLGLSDRYPGYSLSTSIDASVSGSKLENADGIVTVSNIAFTDSTDTGIYMRNLTLYTRGSMFPQQIDLRSDIVDATVSGSYTISTLPGVMKHILLSSLPVLDTEDAQPSVGRHIMKAVHPVAPNDFTFDITLKPEDSYARFLNLPVNVLAPVTINGAVSETDRSMRLAVDAPYLSQKTKLIENTSVIATIDGNDDRSMLYLTTQYPTKSGGMTIAVSNSAAADRIDTDISWVIDRQAAYKGNVLLSTSLRRNDDNELLTNVRINPGTLTFNDTTWTINRADVAISNRRVEIEGINVHRADQFVKIDGVASDDPDDEIVLDILNLNLDYVFESLGIDKVMIGGDATGRFFASGLFSPEPHLDTPGLSVKNIGYNHVTFGDAVVKSHWDADRRAIALGAVIDQTNGCRSLIDGAIFPLNDSLDLRFDANRINVAFMKPYMEAFTSSITGLASGRARLWGNFKYIDMEGDIYGEDVKLKIDFTNTSYTTTDTVHLRQGLIELRNLTVRDDFGNTGQLDGWVRHKFFKEPTFDFTLTHARNLLCYDETSRQNPDWYGRVFGNGGAHISGGPGIVDIDVNISTAANSNFTFVLSNQEEASDYSFITFRDRGGGDVVEEDEFADDTPGIVQHLKALLNRREETAASEYVINLVVDITPDVLITLVMDPVGGDRIRSHGSGNIAIKYMSTDNSLFMNGKYVLDRGNYNFTLQDIILKDFTINAGSSISFTGDPFDARLDIQAVYALTANLSDLDESFLQDKDLNRTNVPVHALLNVTGSIQQPDITFDINFPTLTQDVYRKVKSIISTDDMMNRQIIYLLALNRFYTPDYMSTTKGNVLMSVASSTISSQLSNILGQLSDNWNIAPNFRSDHEDFSDVEVDLALSSNLLNNRLLFNGNFGYRDKALNNNQFIGDFDLEYLLNKSGSVRLKAYNRYNDQNYYVRTANTTQGVGVMFKRNFDNIFSFMRKFRKDQDTVPAEAADSTETIRDIPLIITDAPVDSIAD